MFDLQLEELVGETACVWVSEVGDATEDEDLLVGLPVRRDCHAVVADHADPQRTWDVLYFNPSLLVKEEQEDIVKEWNVLCLALSVITTTTHQKALVDRQVLHGVSITAAWWDSLLLNLHPLYMGDLIFLESALEESKTCVEQLSLGVLASEVVHSIKNGIAHPGNLLVLLPLIYWLGLGRYH